MVSRRVLAFVLILIFSAIGTLPQMQAVPPVPYSILDLGSFGGSLTSALSLTPSASLHSGDEFYAWAAGYSRTPSGVDRAFVYYRGQLQDLGTLGGNSSIARSVNTSGDVAGESRNAAGVWRAFLYTSGAMRDLGALNGTGESFAKAINSNGEIVGGSQTTSNRDSTRAFIYRNGVMTPLGTTFGGTKSVANDINDAGQVVGLAYTANNASHRAFLYDSGTTTDLGTLGGTSEALAINSNGQVVGRSQIGGVQRAFLYSSGALRGLGTLGGSASEAFDINSRGDVVGRAQIAGNAAYHAFLWRNGTMIDLNTLLPPASGWVLERANSINDGGQIVGRGTFGGRTRAFVLSPPVDLAVSQFGDEDLTGNLPRPIQAGRSLFWTLFVENKGELAINATNVTITDTLTGPVEYVSVSIHRGNGTCTIDGRTLECQFPKVESLSFDTFLTISVRTTGAGAFGHTTRITHADQADPNPNNNQNSESNMALSVTGLTLTPSITAGGKAVAARVTLNAPHPHGASVRMTSSNPAVAAVPSTFIVIDSTRSFNIVPAVVSAPTSVQISASYGLVTKTAILTVMPPALSVLQLTPTTAIGGCRSVAARVMLTGAAPATGARVAISESIAAAQFPQALIVPPGAIVHTFTIPTSYVTSYQSGLVTATYGGASSSLTLNVRPIRAQTLAFSPNPVRGGSTATGVVTLECAAAPGPIVVSLTSGNSAVAAPAVPSIVIPAGSLAGSFAVKTSAVTAPTVVPIHASVFGVRKTTLLTINP